MITPAEFADVNSECEQLPVAVALKRRLGWRPSPATIWRWRVKGVNGVKLKTERCGQKWLTTMADVNEFIRQQNETAVSETAVAERDSEKDERLRAAGLI